MSGSNFRGVIRYLTIMQADVCNPFSGVIVKGEVININKLGLLLKNDPLSIIVPREYHENKDVFKTIQINDKLEVEVIGKRYDLNDTEISVIARLPKHYKKNSIIVKKRKIKSKIQLSDDIAETNYDYGADVASMASETEKEFIDINSVTNVELDVKTEELGLTEKQNTEYEVIDTDINEGNKNKNENENDDDEETGGEETGEEETGEEETGEEETDEDETDEDEDEDEDEEETDVEKVEKVIEKKVAKKSVTNDDDVLGDPLGIAFDKEVY